jgi:hypothetical protein
VQTRRTRATLPPVRYNEGKGLRPDHFIQAIRKSQLTPHKNK